MHHIIGDFLSTAVFLDDLGRAYAEDWRGGPGPLAPTIRASSSDWQDEMLAGGGRAALGLLAGAAAGPLPVLDLPIDREPVLRGDRCDHALHLDPALTEALAALGEAQGASLYTTLLAAFQIFLVVGPARTRSSSARPSRDGPGRSRGHGRLLRQHAADAGRHRGRPALRRVPGRRAPDGRRGLEHQDFPFSLMVDRLQAGPDPGRSPIFQVMYAHQRSQRLDEQGLAPFALGVPGAWMDLHGLEVESVTLDRQTALFELSLMTARDGDRLRLAWEYSTDLFADRTVESMASGFRRLLAAIVADPGGGSRTCPCSRRRTAIASWSGGPSARRVEDRDSGIHQRFEREAARLAGRPALVFGAGSLSYGELNRLANVVARDLIGRGVGPEAVVGLFLEEWPLRLVGLLGVLKAGAAYLPLDPGHPAERLASILEDSGAVVLLPRMPSATGCPASDRRVVVRSRWMDRSSTGPDPGNPRRARWTAITWPTSSTPRGPRAGPRA